MQANSAEDEIINVVKRIRETGYSVPIVSSTNKLREELGLKPLQILNTDEIKKIVSSESNKRKK